MRRSRGARRAALPLAVFIAVWAFHYAWLGLFPEQDPAQNGWAAFPLEPSWWTAYAQTGSYWLGYSYSLAFAFAAASARAYREDRGRRSRRFALGGFTFSGLLAVGGCFLIGCCGSPMLVVWLNVFGAAFLPFAKPLVAGITTVSIALAWVWMARQGSRGGCTACSHEDAPSRLPPRLAQAGRVREGQG